MKNIISLAAAMFLAASLLTACVVAQGPPDYGVEVAPPLPAIVELGADPYYYHSGYYYFYQNDHWRYSRSRNGPWTELPRSHWPKEIRHGEHHEHGGEYEHEHEGR